MSSNISLNPDLVSLLWQQASKVRERTIKVFGSIKGQCVAVSDDICDKLEELDLQDFTCNVARGLMKITYKGISYFTPHSCVKIFYENQEFYLDCTLDQFNVFGNDYPVFLLSAEHPMILDIYLPDDEFFEHGKLNMFLCYAS